MFIDTGNKTECFGCEACSQACGVGAISIQEDEEGFRYPIIDKEKCKNCGLCRKVCPYEHMPSKDTGEKYVFGGYTLDNQTRFDSTSGGAFTAIVNSFCDNNYVIFGAEAKGLRVFHSYITEKNELDKFRKSKYSQSIMGYSYKYARDFLKEGKKVLFSGTPYQIAGLISFIGGIDKSNLLTVEVVCEGVPSPLYVRKMEQFYKEKFSNNIGYLDYRYTGKSIFSNGTWDFQKMKIIIDNSETQNESIAKDNTLKKYKKTLIKDRWFNPFWSIWLQHLMSRPSCYKCPFTTIGRVADISLGDLWGVHIYCPELYGKNGGSSLVLCNTEKGKNIFKLAQNLMYGHELKFEDALKYQGPIRGPISENESRDSFMSDLKSNMNFKKLNKKWAKRPTFKLLFQKYVWGNRQKVFLWNLLHRG